MVATFSFSSPVLKEETKMYANFLASLPQGGNRPNNVGIKTDWLV